MEDELLDELWEVDELLLVREDELEAPKREVVARNAAEPELEPLDALLEEELDDEADEVEAELEAPADELDPPEPRPAPVLTEADIRPEPRCPP